MGACFVAEGPTVKDLDYAIGEGPGPGQYRVSLHTNVRSQEQSWTRSACPSSGAALFI